VACGVVDGMVLQYKTLNCLVSPEIRCDTNVIKRNIPFSRKRRYVILLFPTVVSPRLIDTIRDI
jgi:hypothetical protein